MWIKETRVELIRDVLPSPLQHVHLVKGLQFDIVYGNTEDDGIWYVCRSKTGVDHLLHESILKRVSD